MELLIRSLITAFLILNMNSGSIPGRQGKNGDQELPIFTIGIIADAQYADEDPGINRYYRQSLDRLQEAYDTFRSENVNFVINLGDLINSDYNSYKPVMEIVGSSGIETHHLTGNHDYAIDKSMKDKLPVLLHNRKGYGSLNRGNGFRFIFLNGNEISIYAHCSSAEIKKYQAYLDSMKTAGKQNALDWNGGIGKRQLDFLKKELEKATKRNERVIISCHFPVFPENVHNLLNYEEVLNLLNRYTNVVAWLSGHNHAGNYGVSGSAHFITFRGMVETSGTNSFAIIRIYQNRLEIKGYGREPDRVITF